MYLKDIAIKLTAQRKSAVFTQKTDTSIIEAIIKDNDLKIGFITDSKTEHSEIVQYYCTDWDFILSRAEVNSLWVIVDDGTVSVTSPLGTDLARGRVQYKAEHGQTELYEFEIEADIQQQYGAIYSQAWDIKTQALAEAIAAQDNYPLPGNLTPSELAGTIGADRCDLITGVELSPNEIQAWADAKMTKTRLSMFRGRVRVPGFADIKPGDVIEIAGISDRFNGRTRVSGIRHQVSIGGWQTDMQFGLSAAWFSQNQDIVETPASGLLPVVNGLQIGIVDQYEQDTENKYRVRVKVPALLQVTETEGQTKTEVGVVWARLAALDAGLQRGTFFRPEPGDEVVLGFLHDDPRQAIILGALYSEKNPPPWEINENNFVKGIVTKKSFKLTFNEENEKESITLETPKGNKITLTDEKDKESIQLTDKNQNIFVMDKEGIQISSAKNISISAKEGDILIEGKKVDVS